MVGVERLHQHAPWTFPTSGAPRHLRQQLEGALGGAKVGQEERDIGGDRRPTSVTAGRSSPLAIICVPDQHIRAPLGERRESCSCAWRVFAVSRSQRSTRAAGNWRLTADSTRSVPTPK